MENYMIRFVLIVLIGLTLACSVATASTTESPIKRLQAENAALRFQLHYSRRMNNQLTYKIRDLLAKINQLSSDITDCVSKIPPPIGP